MWYNLVHHVLQSAFQATSSSRLIAAMARRKPAIELIYDAVQQCSLLRGRQMQPSEIEMARL
jgi:hypothetical protein